MQIYQKSILARCLPSPKHPLRCPIPTISGTCLPTGCVSSGWKKGGRKSGLRWSATSTGPMCLRWSARGGTCRCRTSSALRRRWMWSLGCCLGRRTRVREVRKAVLVLIACGRPWNCTDCWGPDVLHVARQRGRLQHPIATVATVRLGLKAFLPLFFRLLTLAMTARAVKTTMCRLVQRVG